MNLFIIVDFICMVKSDHLGNNVVIMFHTDRKLTRLCDSLALRISRSQRRYLEQTAIEKGVSLGEAARMCIDLAMSKGGAERC